MGFLSIKIAPGVRLSASSRGLRAGIGPRAARIHVGAGRTTISSGAGPVTVGTSLGGSHRGRRTGPTPPPASSSGSWVFVAIAGIAGITVLALVAACIVGAVMAAVGG
jgi:hypothetical protein